MSESIILVAITVTAGGMEKLGGWRTGVLYGQKWIR